MAKESRQDRIGMWTPEELHLIGGPPQTQFVRGGEKAVSGRAEAARGDGFWMNQRLTSGLSGACFPELGQPFLAPGEHEITSRAKGRDVHRTLMRQDGTVSSGHGVEQTSFAVGPGRYHGLVVRRKARSQNQVLMNQG